MEIQWPLALFTTFLAWSAGTFAAQGVLALKGKGERAQFPLLVIAAVMLAVGGIAVFFHLEHWERIFNGFGHLSSGITQELIVIVIMAIIGIVYFAMMRRNEGKVPTWCAVAAIVVSVALIIVMAHSYMMPARPVWNSPLWIVAVLGNACVLGPVTAAVVCSLVDAEAKSEVAMMSLIGSAVNAVTTVAYAVAMHLASETPATVDYYHDPTHPTQSIVGGTVSPFLGDTAAIMWVGVIVIGALVPLVAAFMGKKTGAWRVWGAVALVAAFIGALCLRAVFYDAGVSMFMFF